MYTDPIPSPDKKKRNNRRFKYSNEVAIEMIQRWMRLRIYKMREREMRFKLSLGIPLSRKWRFNKLTGCAEALLI